MFNFGHIPKICNSFIFMFAEFRFLPVQNGFACCKNIYIYIYTYSVHIPRPKWFHFYNPPIMIIVPSLATEVVAILWPAIL